MPIEFKCAECQAALRVKDAFGGKKMKCPKCAKVIAIPESDDDDEVYTEVDVVDDSPTDDQLFGLDEPGAKKKGAVREPARPRGKTWGKYMPCPHCNGREAKKVKWTWWGSFYGPRLFTHVRCVDCGYRFNGKTGDSNLIPALLFVAIPLVLIVVVLVIFYIWLLRTDNWPPWRKFWN